MKKISTKAKKDVRLSKDVVPINYRLHLKPDMKKFVFSGEDIITISIKKATQSITMHSLDIKVSKATLLSDEVGKPKISYDAKKQTVTFTFAKKIQPGLHDIEIIFTGELNDKLHGFYRSSYEHGGVTKHLGVTQFESTEARRAFPCFDEPAMKATFDVTLTVPKDQVAISNTLPDKIEENGQVKTVHFVRTPIMSTYLLAFIVGEFEHIETKTKDGILVRVFTTPGKKHQGEFALDCAVKALAFYTDYFGIPYPLPVMDLIAIPDFAAGAMENWGAVTYRETALLVDPEHSALTAKKRVALVVCHELAHQWFGNLVTMQWWTHLWLNEGFATYMEYLALDHIFPEWNIWTQFAADDFDAAFKMDCHQNQHPIEVEVNHPEEIREVFDAMSYSKGASIIRMLVSYIGEKNFRAGLHDYLKKHSYNNAETADLWAAFERSSGMPVAKMMHNWTAHAGYPVVTAEHKGAVLTLSQERFLASGKKAKDDPTWTIPLDIRYSNKKKPSRIVMEKKSMKTEHSGTWYKLNDGETAYARMRYPKDIQSALAKPILTKELSSIDRLGLIRDMGALATAGKVSTTDVLDFLKHYQNETDYMVWLAVTDLIVQLESLFLKEKFIGQYRAYALPLFENVLKSVGFKKVKGEKDVDTLLRTLVLNITARYDHPEVIAWGKEEFAKVMKGEHLDPDLRGPVYRVGAITGGAKAHAWFIAQHKKATLHEEKNRLAAALSSFRDKELIEKTIDFIFSDAVRSQDVMPIMGAVWANPYARDVVWSQTKKRWSTINKKFGALFMMMARFVGFAGSLVTDKEMADFKKFFAGKKVPGAEREIKLSLDRISAKNAWINRDRKPLVAYFSQK